MADKISATINIVDTSNKKSSKSITDISPTATNIAIKNFCVALNALSTNTISSIEKIERTDITNPAKTTRTLTISPSEATPQSTYPLTVNLTYDGTATTAILSGKAPQYTISQNVEAKTITFAESETSIMYISDENPQTMTITIPEDTNYTAATATFTWKHIASGDYRDL